MISQHEMDIATAVIRMRQIKTLLLVDDDGLVWSIVDRLLTCDLPRLQRSLSTEAMDLVTRVENT